MKSLSLRLVLFCLLLLCLRLPALADAPNIIFVMADDLGYSHLGCYGQQKIKTPNIDRLAMEGTRYLNCYAGASVCAPSRSVLMTGMHGGHTSVRGNSGGIPLLDSDITVGEVLQSAGYHTGVFGKWGLGDHHTDGIPNKQGFDEFFGYLHQVHCHFYYPWFLWDNQEKYPLPGNDKGKREQYTHDVIMEKALDFVSRNRNKKFFLYLPFTIPHTELLVPEESLKQYDGRFPEPNPYTGTHYANQPQPRTAFAAMVSHMDRDVGRLMKLLNDLDLEENTIVFFTSDNGGQNGGGPDLEFFNGNAPLRGAKGQLYEGGIRVPMIVKWPGKVEAGAIGRQVWAFQDLLPTLAEIGGAKLGHKVDGFSMAHSLMTGGAIPANDLERYYYWEQPRGKQLWQAVRWKCWKAIRQGQDKPIELYDLGEDIGETSNVAANCPDVVKRLTAFLDSAHVPPRKYEPEPPAWGWPAEKTGYVR